METIKKALNIELDDMIGHLISKQDYHSAIGLLETFKEHYGNYEHYKRIIIQQYRR